MSETMSRDSEIRQALGRRIIAYLNGHSDALKDMTGLKDQINYNLRQIARSLEWMDDLEMGSTLTRVTGQDEIGQDEG